jgi:sigma-B regulation protein RsbU (phosphoserine phosphatase)
MDTTGSDNSPSRANERSSRLAQGLGLLADMSRDFADTRDIDGTLSRALVHISEYLDAEGGALFLLEDDGRILRCTASVGVIQIVGLTLPSDHGVVGSVVQSNSGRIVRDAADDPDFDKSVDERTGFHTRSILCAPMSVADQCIGAIELINKRGSEDPFEDADLALLEILCSSAAMALLNARLAASLVEQERVKREIELAAEIQRNLLPATEKRDFPIFGFNIPAREVSGDFYDYFVLADGRIAWCLGDVSGKGINAALLMAKTASLYRCLGKTETDLSRLLARINDEIVETATRGMFVTLIGGIYDPAKDTICFANAGHEPPLYHGRDGTFAEFPADAPPLGILPSGDGGNRFPQETVTLNGGAFYVFTDGVTEGKLPDGVPLGADGVKRTVAETANLPLDERLKTICRMLDRDDGALHDDITVLGIDAAHPAGAQHLGLDDTDKLFTYRFAARADLLQGARNAVREYLTGKGLSTAITNDVVLVVDEACQNVIRHAYHGQEIGDIVLYMTLAGIDDAPLTPRHLVIHVRDFAAEIDGITVAPRKLDDIRPGGLGTHFMREIMDEVAYLRPREGTGNLLRMTKEIPTTH